MVDRAALPADLKGQVGGAEKDPAAQVKAVPEVGARLRGEYDRAREQAHALATHLTNQPLTEDQAAALLAGLAELQPWLDQWHHDFDPAYGGSPAAFFARYRRQLQTQHGLTDDDTTHWRPPTAKTRGTKNP